MSLMVTGPRSACPPWHNQKIISEVYTKENEGNILYHKHITEIRNHWQTLVNTASNAECYINNEAFSFNHKNLNNQHNTLLLMVKTPQCLVYFADS